MKLTTMMHKIRLYNKTNKYQKINCIILPCIMGLISGFLAKLFDSPYMPQILGNIGSQLGIWVVIATLLASFSYTPKLASIRVFIFFTSMLIIYYLYTIFFLHFLPKKYIVFWGLMTIIASLMSYIIWFSRSEHWISNLIISLPVSIILYEAYEIFLYTTQYYKKAQIYELNASDNVYYNMIYMEIIYFCFIVIILVIVPKNKKQDMIIIPISIVINIILIKTNILDLLFMI